MNIFAKVIALLVMTSLAAAQDINAEKLKACEKEYRAKAKEDDAKAPAGYKPIRPRNARQQFIVECLTK